MFLTVHTPMYIVSAIAFEHLAFNRVYAYDWDAYGDDSFESFIILGLVYRLVISCVIVAIGRIFFENQLDLFLSSEEAKKLSNQFENVLQAQSDILCITEKKVSSQQSNA